MKLFTRSLLLIASIILFQALITAILVTQVVRQNNGIELTKELTEESASIAEHFYSWKRVFWIHLLRYRDELDHSVARTSEDSFLQEFFIPSGVDYLFLLGWDTDFYRSLSLSNKRILFDPHILPEQRDHPFIQLREYEGQLFLVGMMNEDSNLPFRRMVLVKKLDTEFCYRMKGKHRSEILLTARDLQYSGTEESASDELWIDRLYRPDKAGYSGELDDFSYSVVKAWPLFYESGNELKDLFIITFLSHAPYTKRLFIIDRTLVIVSIFVVFLSIFLSPFISRNITQPVQKLIWAMKRIQQGEYDTTIRIKASEEIRLLIEGFNQMAGHLLSDRRSIDNYIREITWLKEYNEKIIHSLRAGIGLINKEMKLETTNLALDRILGLEGMNFPVNVFDLFSSPLIDEGLINNIGFILNREKEQVSWIRRTGSNRVFDIELYPLHGIDGKDSRFDRCFLIIEDISSETELEEKIFQAEKLSSISLLSAGVAHEINNPLGSIMSNVQNLISVENDRENLFTLQMIEQETLRIAEIVRSLLDFSASNHSHDSVSDINDIIVQVVSMMKYSYRSTSRHIEYLMDIQDNIPNAYVGADELKQVIINLIMNSQQAIEDTGWIRIRTAFLTEEDMLEVLVEDNGSGIDEKIIPRLFDPFFTTKGNGEGTGLGLSVVYGIMRKYNGSVKVFSEKGAGTSISLLFRTPGGILL